MKKKFSLLMMVLFASHAIMFTQIIPYLTHVGYNPIQRGYILTAYALFGMIGQVLFGYLSDRHATIKRFIIIATVMVMISGFLTFQFQALNFSFHFLLMSITAGSTRIVGNLLETWILEVDTVRDDFSFIRSFGSLGWGLASLLSGVVAIRLGYQYLGYISILLSLLALWIAVGVEDASKTSAQNLVISDLAVLFKNKNYVLLVVAYFLIYVIYNSDVVTVTEYIFYLGGDAQDVGTKMFLQALSEIPVLFLGSRLLKRFNAVKLLKASLVILLLRFALTGMATSVNQVILLSLLQAVTFPIILITQRQLIYEEVPEGLKSSGQMMAFSLSTSLSAIVSPLLSSYLLTLFPMEQVLFILAAIVVIPFLLLGFYKGKLHA
ncbi:MAG TPA: MFS transporter [Erysipelothrix sp.]